MRASSRNFLDLKSRNRKVVSCWFTYMTGDKCDICIYVYITLSTGTQGCSTGVDMEALRNSQTAKKSQNLVGWEIAVLSYYDKAQNVLEINFALAILTLTTWKQLWNRHACHLGVERMEYLL